MNTTVYDLDNDKQIHYSLPPHEALRNAFELIVKKNNNTWEYRPVHEYKYETINNRTLVIENSGICCAYSPN
jgi:hypothetical protein